MTKKIALFSHASALEGAEKSLLTTAENLKRLGWEVLVIVREEGLFTKKLDESHISFQKLRYSWWETTGENTDANWARLNYLAAHEAAMLIRSFGAKLAYTNTSVIAIGAMAAALAEIPHIYHIRELASGLIFDTHIKALPGIGKFIGNTSNSIVFNSQATLASWKSFLPEGTRFEIIYNPLTKPKNTPSANALPGLNISVIGSITPLKSQLEVLKAVKILSDKGIEPKLRIIGPVRNMKYKEELDTYIATEAIEKHVNFVGYKKAPYELASVGQLIIVPGNTEGFGRVTAESMLAGIPVIAASGGATNELISDGETGYLYEKGNSEQLAEKIELLLSHPENLNSVLENGRKHIEELCSSENSYSALFGLFERTLNEDNPLSSWAQMINPFVKTDEILPLVKSNKLISILKNRVLKRGKRNK